MRYVFDTEFWERGSDFPIIPISIGIVAEDGRELYCVNGEMPYDEIKTDAPWLQEKVMPHLFKGDRIHLCPRKIIAEEILAFVGTDTNPEFWAYFADYDWVVLCQLFGTMIQLPGHFPMWCRDVKQLMSDLGIKREQLPQQTGTEHNALEDARWTRECLDYLLKEKEKYIRIPTVEEHYHDITKKKCGPTCPWPSYGRRATELSHDQGIWY